MKKYIAVVATVAALAVTGTASAHFGDIWFQTRAGVTDAVESKYRLDVFKTCLPKGTHILKDGFKAASYDHFYCLVDVIGKPGRTCWVTAHITGPQWSDIVLTSDKGTGSYKGCGSWDIRRR